MTDNILWYLNLTPFFQEPNIDYKNKRIKKKMIRKDGNKTEAEEEMTRIQFGKIK